jgi:DNA-binding MarR family transcriptional regulator
LGKSTRGPTSPGREFFRLAFQVLEVTMKMPSRSKTSKSNRRLSPAEWIACEELYRQGWTQAQLADKYKVRIETVSRHMTKKSIKGGERAETVREELAAALSRKQREFAESKAQRQIDSKEMLYKMTNILVGSFAKEMQSAMASGKGLAALQGSARALKDSLMSMKLGREEMYTLLDIEGETNKHDLPDLMVSSMSEVEETELRNRVAPDEDEDEHLASEMQDVIASIEHQVDAANG